MHATQREFSLTSCGNAAACAGNYCTCHGARWVQCTMVKNSRSQKSGSMTPLIENIQGIVLSSYL